MLYLPSHAVFSVNYVVYEVNCHITVKFTVNHEYTLELKNR